MRSALLALLGALPLLAVTALAQNAALPAAYATVNHAAAESDPIVVRVIAGGTIDARRLGGTCVGMIGAPPDVRLDYRASHRPLVITVRSPADTTLVIGLPDGQWLCNDDFQGLNPGVVLHNPPSGSYAIWVGTFGAQTAPAELLVSETPPR